MAYIARLGLGATREWELDAGLHEDDHIKASWRQAS